MPAEAECGLLTLHPTHVPGRAQGTPIHAVATNQVALGNHAEEA